MSSIFGISSPMGCGDIRAPTPASGRADLTSNVAATNVTGATSEKSDNPSVMDVLLDEILQKGLMRWGQDQRIEALKAKLREEALQGLGMTEEELAKMPPEQRAEIEKRISDAIRQRLEAALAEGQKKQKAESLAPGQPAPKAKPSLIINI